MNTTEITELLELRGWSQAQLARELDLTEGAVSRWVNGQRTPTGPTRKYLRRLLDEARRDHTKQPA